VSWSPTATPVQPKQASRGPLHGQKATGVATGLEAGFERTNAADPSKLGVSLQDRQREGWLGFTTGALRAPTSTTAPVTTDAASVPSTGTKLYGAYAASYLNRAAVQRCIMAAVLSAPTVKFDTLRCYSG